MNGLMDFNFYIIDHFSIVRNIFSIENVGMLIIPTKTQRYTAVFIYFRWWLT